MTNSQKGLARRSMCYNESYIHCFETSKQTTHTSSITRQSSKANTSIGLPINRTRHRESLVGISLTTWPVVRFEWNVRFWQCLSPSRFFPTMGVSQEILKPTWPPQNLPGDFEGSVSYQEILNPKSHQNHQTVT